MIEFAVLASMAAVPLLICVWCVVYDRRNPPGELTDSEAAAQDAWEDQYDAAYWAHR